MQERPNYYAIIPAEVRYDERLRPNEKLLFGEITALSNTLGVCIASNNYFARLYKVVPSAITRWVKDLEKYDYIKVNYIKEGKEIKQRIIKITGIHKYDEVFTNVVEGYSQKVKDNNTSINNKKEIYKEKPSLDEVIEYCKERNNNVDPNKFYDYYEVNNWVDNKGNKVRNWKQKVITWENHSPDNIELPSWFNKDIKASATEEEQEEMKNILKEFI